MTRVNLKDMNNSVGWRQTSETTNFCEFLLHSDCPKDEIEASSLMSCHGQILVPLAGVNGEDNANRARKSAVAEVPLVDRQRDAPLGLELQLYAMRMS